MRERKSLFSLATSVVGIYCCYLAYGIFQEGLYMRQTDGSTFSATTFVLAWQCLANFSVALIGAFTQRWLQGDDKNNKAGRMRFAWVNVLTTTKVAQASVVYVLAMFASNEALSFVSYPTQVLVKSCKMIPVMAGSVLIGGKRYSLVKYFSVALMTAGIIIFQSAGRKSHETHSPQGDRTTNAVSKPMIGMLLLLLSLALDGATGPLQEVLKRSVALSSMEQILVNNFWGFLVMLFAALFSGQFFSAMHYLFEHPSLAKNLLLFGCCSAFGQIFVFRTIRTFSALTLSTITTTRKILTILASVAVYGHKLSGAQCLGIIGVFVGLLLEAF